MNFMKSLGSKKNKKKEEKKEKKQEKKKETGTEVCLDVAVVRDALRAEISDGDYARRVFWSGLKTSYVSGTMGDKDVFHELDTLRGMTLLKIAGGHDHSIFLDDEGNVYSLGMGSAPILGYELPTGTTCSIIAHKLKFGDGKTKAVDIAASIKHSVIVTEKGEVYTFGSGYGDYAHLGTGKEAPTPTLVELFKDGKEHFALKAFCDSNETGIVTESKLIVFGSGFGTVPSCLIMDLPPDSRVKEFGVSQNHVVILTEKGKIFYTSSNNERGWRKFDWLPQDGYFADMSCRGDAIIALEGFPTWNFHSHRLYPTEFKKCVLAFLSCALRDEKHNPRHPEALLWMLPKELLIQIVEYLACAISKSCTAHIFYPTRDQHKLDVANLEITKVAAGYGHYVLLSASGKVYFFGGGTYGQFGHTRQMSATNLITTDYLADLPVKDIYAGSYHTFLLF